MIDNMFTVKGYGYVKVHCKNGVEYWFVDENNIVTECFPKSIGDKHYRTDIYDNDLVLP